MLLIVVLAAEAVGLHLICPGQGLDTKVGVATAQTYSSNGTMAGASVYQRRALSFDDQLEIDISGGVGRVRLPRRLVTPIHGGKDGWYDVKDLVIGPDAIDAKVPINFTNSPRMHINRITGSVAVEGRDGSFSGTCQAYDPASVKHAF